MRMSEATEHPQEQELPPTYDEALSMTRILASSTPTLAVYQHHIPVLQSCLPDPAGERGRGNFSSLMSPEPPNYYQTCPMVEHTAPSPSSGIKVY